MIIVFYCHIGKCPNHAQSLDIFDSKLSLATLKTI